MNKKLLPLLFLLVFPIQGRAIELGAVGGHTGNPSEMGYGLSSGFGLIIPFLKTEIDWFRLPGSRLNFVSVSVKLRPKLGKFSPFVAAGVGTQFEKVAFDFGGYDWFSLIGGGIHYFFSGFFSIRLDVRFQNFSDRSRMRIAAGVFFHL